jgi:hypothetical protein
MSFRSNFHACPESRNFGPNPFPSPKVPSLQISGQSTQQKYQWQENISFVLLVHTEKVGGTLPLESANLGLSDSCKASFL